MKSILVYILFLSIGFACTKDASPLIKPSKTLLVSDELKEWAYFKPGSYWIYKDSLSNSLDSVSVSSIVTEHETHDSSGDTIIVWEVITVYFNATSYKPYDFYILKPDNKLSNYIGPGYPYDIFDLDTNRISVDPQNGIQKNYSSPSLNLNGITYLNARYIYTGVYHKYGQYYERSYWKKNIGLLKKNMYPQSHNSELLKYHVEQ